VKQAEARAKYARDAEMKAVVAEAAEAAGEKGFGAHAIDEGKVDEWNKANSWDQGLPDWQKAAMEAPLSEKGAKVALPPRCGSNHCVDEACAPSPLPVLPEPDKSSVSEGPVFEPQVKSIEALYEFTDSVEGEELDFAIPEWPAAAEAKEWRSVGMRDAVQQDVHQKKVEAVVERNESKRGGKALFEVVSEAISPSKEKLSVLAEAEIPGEVNYYRIAQNMCAEVREATLEMSGNFKELDFNKPKERKKLVVLDDSDEEEEEEMLINKENKGKSPSNPLIGKKTESKAAARAALREARLAQMRHGTESCPSLRDQSVGNSRSVSEIDNGYFNQPAPHVGEELLSPSSHPDDAMSDAAFSYDASSTYQTTMHATKGVELGEDLHVEDWNRGLPPVARAPRLVSKRHLAAMGGRPEQKEDAFDADEVSNAFALD